MGNIPINATAILMAKLLLKIKSECTNLRY